MEKNSKAMVLFKLLHDACLDYGELTSDELLKHAEVDTSEQDTTEHSTASFMVTPPTTPCPAADSFFPSDLLDMELEDWPHDEYNAVLADVMRVSPTLDSFQDVPSSRSNELDSELDQEISFLSSEPKLDQWSCQLFSDRETILDEEASRWNCSSSSCFCFLRSHFPLRYY